jgi:hypothetical protein
MRRRAAEGGRKKQAGLKGGIVWQKGKGGRNRGDQSWSNRPAVFRVLKNQVAEKAGFVFEPVGMMVEGPCQREDRKKKAEEEKKFSVQRSDPARAFLPSLFFLLGPKVKNEVHHRNQGSRPFFP